MTTIGLSQREVTDEQLMLLAIDIGNTNIVLGAFLPDRSLKKVWRLKTVPDRTPDEYAGLLSLLFQQEFGAEYSFERCIISSVVPPITPELVRFVVEKLCTDPLVVGPGIKTGISINIKEPSNIGSDRVVNAVAAKHLHGTPALVIDFGTGTTFDLISESGAYEGGVIIPGVKISLDALVSHTAKLPRIELAWPEQIVGKTTVEAMQSGSTVGYFCAVEGLIDKVQAEVGQIPHIIATGGLGKLFFERSEKITAYEPELTLIGLQVIAEQNNEEKSIGR